MVTQDIGGGFGNKITSHPQLVACCLLARKLNRPIQWTEWRTEFHQSMSHGNERWFQDVEVAVMADGTMTGLRCRAIDDAGAYLRYEPLGGVIWSQVAAGLYGWRNIRLEFTQAMTNKAPVSPNRGYSRMQQLWLTERVIDIVAAELGFDPVEIRKRNYVKAEQMPYETPNGCVYDSGDYAGALDIALELIDSGSIEARREEAAARGKLLGFGIGSTLDSGTNNFGQSTLLNPELQFSGNNEAASVKLDIFGEVVVTLGTVPQGQGHETTAAQGVADILGCTPDQVNVRRGHDTWFNSHAGCSGTYASQFAFTGLGAVKGASELLRDEMSQLAAAGLQAPAEASERADGMARIKDGPEEAALPFMALGAIVNANNAFLPPEFNPTLNHRYVCRPYFGMVDKEKKTGKLTLTYATQIHAAVVEIDPDTGEVDVVDYAAVDDCGVRINPQIVEGQVHGATAHALGAALSEEFVYDEEGTLLTSNFYDYHVPHAMDMPPLKTGAMESPSPVAPLGAKGMGEGGGGGIHCICAAI
jgi:2-furoyl-CoA dehydrogenase large subunit